MKIAFYISNHGYGHATRMAALAEEFMKCNVLCYFLTNRPSRLFNNLDPQYMIYKETDLDFGVIQKNWNEIDKEATVSELTKLWNNRSEIINAEVSYCLQERFDLIIADIPFFAFEIASKAKIPIYAVSNFDWFYIYEQILPQLQEEIKQGIALYYQKATKVWQLPFSDMRSMSAFSEKIPAGLLARRGTKNRSKICLSYSIPWKNRIVLVSLGTDNTSVMAIQQLCAVENCTVLSSIDLQHPQYRKIDELSRYEDILASVDLVVTKSGYSTIAETVPHGSYLLCVQRDHYPEDRVLDLGLSKYNNKKVITVEQLEKLNWQKLMCDLPHKHIQPKYYSYQTVILAKQMIREICVSLTKKYVVIDVGTNNILLLWAVKKGEQVQVVHRASAVSALGRGMVGKMITTSAMKRAKSILKRFIDLSLEFTKQIIVVGTSCSRESTNIDELRNWLYTNYRLTYHLLSGEEEAMYNGLATIVEFPELSHFISFDIGGGSTEFTVIEQGRVVDTLSIPLGIRRLNNLYGKDWGAKMSYTRDALSSLPSYWKDIPFAVGIGGTVANLGAMRLNLYRYESERVHKSILYHKEIKEFMQQICRMTDEEIAIKMPFEPQRAQIISSGVMVIDEILTVLNKEQFWINDHGLQFGILCQDLAFIKDRYLQGVPNDNKN